MRDACLDVEDALSFVDGPLPEWIEAHLADCPDCRELVAELAREDEAAPFDEGVLPKGARLGRFEILGLLGRGGMGVVYEAKDPQLARRLAIKLVSIDVRASDPQESKLRLLQEARALAALSHPNVVSVFDVGEYGDAIYIAMELIEGESLRRWLEGASRSLEDILTVFTRAGRGLAAAHRAGFVHRDFKPDNVLVTEDHQAKVVDFGLARVTGAAGPQGQDTAPTLQTRTDVVVGTPAYMAPEQYAGRPIDARSDQFSFCVSLYGALYGRHPLQGDSVEAALKSLQDEGLRPPRLKGLSARRRAALLRGLSFEPERRFASMEALLRALAPPRSKWRFAVAALALPAVGLLWWSPGPRCDGSPQRAEGIFSPRISAALLEELTEAQVPSPAATHARLSAALKGYRASWVQTHREVCLATRVQGHQSEAVMERKMACLEQRRRQAQLLVDFFKDELTGPRLRRGLAAAFALPSPKGCAREGAALKLPEAPQLRAKVRALELELSELETQLVLSQLAQRERAAALLSSAQALGHAPLIARAHQVLAGFERAAGAPFDAERHLRTAIELAARSREDPLLGPLWTDLVTTLTDQDRYTDAIATGAASLAAIARAGDEPNLLSRALRTIANALSWELNYERALPMARRAVAEAEAAGFAGQVSLIESLSLLTQLLCERGQAQEALEHAERALTISQNLYGEMHAGTHEALFSLGQAQAATGAHELALQTMRRAIKDDVALRGGHPTHSYAYEQIGLALTELGRCDDALRTFQRAIELAAPYVGARGYSVGIFRRSMARCELEMGHPEAARNALDAALEITEARRGLHHPATVLTHLAYAQLELQTDRASDAVARLTKVRAFQDRAHEPWLKAKVEALLSKARDTQKKLR